MTLSPTKFRLTFPLVLIISSCATEHEYETIYGGIRQIAKSYGLPHITDFTQRPTYPVITHNTVPESEIAVFRYGDEFIIIKGNSLIRLPSKEGVSFRGTYKTAFIERNIWGARLFPELTLKTIHWSINFSIEFVPMEQ